MSSGEDFNDLSLSSSRPRTSLFYVLPASTPNEIVASDAITEQQAQLLIAEAQSAYRPDYSMGRSPFGISTTRFIRVLSDQDAPLTAEDVVTLGCRAVRESLQTARPTGTDIGRVLLARADDFTRGRRSGSSFHEVLDATTREAAGKAARLESELPAFADLLDTILMQSARALRRMTLDHGHASVALFRGVSGTGSPQDLEAAAAGRYPLRALSSWSTDFDAAEVFARRHGAGVVLEADVPAGCLALAPGYGEYEVLIFPVDPTGNGRAEGFHDLRIRALHVVDR